MKKIWFKNALEETVNFLILFFLAIVFASAIGGIAYGIYKIITLYGVIVGVVVYIFVAVFLTFMGFTFGEALKDIDR